MVSHVTTNYQRQLQDLSNTYCLSINPINLTDLDKLTHASSTGPDKILHLCFSALINCYHL